MLFMGVIGGKRYLLFTYMKSKFKRRFVFPGSFSSEPWTFPHHCGWESTFKIWFINAAWSIVNSSFTPYELHQKGSQSTGAGQQPVTAWWAASHSAGLEGVPERILEVFRISTSIAAQDLLQSLHVQPMDTKGYAPIAVFLCCWLTVICSLNDFIK